jgi:hypothetical protein
VASRRILEAMTAAELMVVAALIPATIVFVVAYRHALTHWLAPVQAELPSAAVAGRPLAPPASFWRRFHAAAIALAFVSMAMMVLMFLAILAVALLR